MDNQYDFVKTTLLMILYKRDQHATDVLVEHLETFQERELLEIGLQEKDDEYLIVLCFKNMGGSQIRLRVSEEDGVFHMVRETIGKSDTSRVIIWKAG